MALTPTLNIRELPEWDWITNIYFVIAVEDAFGVRFRIGEAEAAKNIGEFAELILKRLEQKVAERNIPQ